MKDMLLNPLDANKRRLLQLAVVILLIIVLYAHFALSGSSKKQRVILRGSTLTAFNDTYKLNSYPDRVLFHDPYIIVVQADKPLTTVYNLKTKRKEAEYREVLLDYFQGNIVYNKSNSYINDLSLGKYCDIAFIKNVNEVLCVTRPEQDAIDNMLISINPSTPNLWKRVYKTDRLITTVSVFNNGMYIGEIDRKTNRNYISINNKSYPVNNIVNVVYPLQGNVYFASFASALNSGKQAYYSFMNGTSVQKAEGEIVFFDE